MPVTDHESGIDRSRIPAELREQIMAALQRGDDTYDDVLDAVEAHWPTRRLVLDGRQLHALGEVAGHADDSPECVLLPHDELTRIGLDLPDGTVELRQGDGFCAVTPDGKAVEST